MQTRRHSLYEVFSGTFIGLLGSWLIVLSVFTYLEMPTVVQTTVSTILCTIWSLVRGYFIRRYWNKKLK